MKPLVSIIIPTFNRARLLSETLRSVVAQTHSNWECIIVDDGSTDNTEEIIKEYVTNDNRFQYYCRPNGLVKGASSCRNIGLSKCSGDFVQFLDSDDIIESNKFEVQLLSLFKESYKSVAICKWGIFDTDIAKSNIKENLPYYRNFESCKDLFNVLGTYGLYIPLHCFLINKNLVVNAGKWNEELSINDDGEFFSRLLINADKIVYVESTVVYYRKNYEMGLSTYNKENLKKIKYSWELIEKHLKPIYNGRKILYVTNAKMRIFKQTKGRYPFFIWGNVFFFLESIAHYYVKKLIDKFKTNFK